MPIDADLPILVTLARISSHFHMTADRQALTSQLTRDSARDMAELLTEYPEKPSAKREKYAQQLTAIRELAGVA